MTVLAGLLAFAGCGGGDGPSSLSKAEYTHQLQLVCNKGAQERETLVTNISRDYYEKREQRTNTKYQEENLLKLIDTYQGTTEKISDLGLPEGDEKKAEEFIRAREEAAAKVEASPLGTRDNLQAIFENPNEKSQALGVGNCDL
ncbi:MAG TPA: hypothetical protein VLK37_03450 [Solirubrobacterales bacterium]|nr:hypothetical protein [Solirubrobacterales bacterium]